MNRINFLKEVKMHEACGEINDIRPFFAYIYFSNGYAYASEGHILVRNKISEISTFTEEQIETLNSNLLYKNHYSEILRYKVALIGDEGITCFNEGEGVFFKFDNLNEYYPDVDSVINGAINNPDKPVSSVVLNVNLLIRLHNALYNSDACKFTFKGENKAIVLSCGESESVGIIMPQMDFNK